MKRERNERYNSVKRRILYFLLFFLKRKDVFLLYPSQKDFVIISLLYYKQDAK